MTPSGASWTVGEKRRSMIPVGKCHRISTTLARAPASVSAPTARSNSAASRGPTPGSVVTGANRGNRRLGRIRFAEDAADSRMTTAYILFRHVRNHGGTAAAPDLPKSLHRYAGNRSPAGPLRDPPRARVFRRPAGALRAAPGGIGSGHLRLAARAPTHPPRPRPPPHHPPQQLSDYPLLTL